MSRVYEALRQAEQEAKARVDAQQQASGSAHRHCELTFPGALEAGIHRLEEKERALRLLEAKLDGLLRRLETSGDALEALLARAARFEQSHRINKEKPAPQLLQGEPPRKETGDASSPAISTGRFGPDPESLEVRKALHQQVGQAVLSLAEWTDHCKGALQANRDEILEGLSRQVAKVCEASLERYRRDVQRLARELQTRLERAARTVGEAGTAASAGEP
jgi:hypothetical protein